MSSDDELYVGDPGQDGDSQSELARLNALHDDLVEAVQTAINPTVRADLAAELRSVRERIAELSMGDGGVRRAPEPGATMHSYEVPAGPGEGNGAAAMGGVGRYDEDERYAAPGRGPVGGGYDRGPSYGYQEPAYGPPPYGGPPPGSDPMWNRQPGGYADPRQQVAQQVAFDPRSAPRRSFWSERPWLPLVLAIVVGLVLAAVVGFGGLFGGDDGSGDVASEEAGGDPAGPDGMESAITDIRSMLDSMGFSAVSVEDRAGSVALVGSVASDTDRQAVIGAASALAGNLPFDSSGLTVVGDAATPGTQASSGPGAAMQRELDRILAATPITFDEGQVAVTERHQLILNNVVTTMAAYPDEQVTIVGYTDDQGSVEANDRLSSARAQNVKDYLVSQGVSGDRLDVRGLGEVDATGSENLRVLERRVVFEVAGVAAPSAGALRVGMVGPSASNDLAFTQSMVDALNVVAGERGLQVDITDSTFVEAEAADVMRNYAEQGYDLVVAHGSQFGPNVKELATAYPDVAFAWGTASDTFDLPNVYAYDAKAEEGGYVLGAVASELSGSGTLGVVGPIEVGDAELYVNGFKAGAEAQRPGVDVRVEYIGSFSEISLAAQAATDHLEAGADVLTGSAQMVVGAVEVGAAQGVPWFGNQANQSSLAPNLVVASQVYHWEVVLRPILDDVAAGRLGGTVNSLTLANNGLVIEYNDGYALSAEARQVGDQLAGQIAAGTLTP